MQISGDHNGNLKKKTTKKPKLIIITVTIIELQSLSLETTPILTPELTTCTIYILSLLFFVIRRKISPYHLNKEAIQKLIQK